MEKNKREKFNLSLGDDALADFAFDHESGKESAENFRNLLGLSQFFGESICVWKLRSHIGAFCKSIINIRRTFLFRRF